MTWWYTVEPDPQQHVLVVDDDKAFAETLARTLERHGFSTAVAFTKRDALELAEQHPPDFAIVDLRLGHESGISLAQPLKALNDAMRVIVLTGYASIPTAVKAVKKGVDNYLAKPVDTQAVLAALLGEDEREDETDENYQAMSLRRLEWEHIQRVLAENNGNISATARALNMHRRTLQRKLAKRPVRD